MKYRHIGFIVLCMLFFSPTACGQTLKVAVAANLQSVIKVLGNDFKKRSGITIEPIVGSSGKLVAQISNGAPYDIFLSADMEFPQKLTDGGFAEQKPVVYALGSLIICNSQEIDLKNWADVIKTNQVEKIAIANSKTAPYGRAAEEVLAKLNILDKVRPKLVYGESIAQVNTYITTGVVSIGFTSQSLVSEQSDKKSFQWVPVDRKLYTPIQQGMVLLKKSDNKIAAAKFYRYILSAPAKSILKKYGYIIP